MTSAVEKGELRLLRIVGLIMLLCTGAFLWMVGRPLYWYLTDSQPVRFGGASALFDTLKSGQLDTAEIEQAQKMVESVRVSLEAEAVAKRHAKNPNAEPEDRFTTQGAPTPRDWGASRRRRGNLAPGSLMPPPTAPLAATDEGVQAKAPPPLQDAAEGPAAQHTRRWQAQQARPVAAPEDASQQQPTASAEQAVRHTSDNPEGHGVALDPVWHVRRPRENECAQGLEDEYELRSDNMRGLADKDGYIMVTWANDHYFNFVKNWVEHVEEAGISSYVVGAMDEAVLCKLVQAGMPAFSMKSGLTTKDFGWGSKNFHIMGRKKIALVQQFTEMNLTVIISDVDTVWMRSPFEYFKRYPEADVLTSSDALAATHDDDGLEDWTRSGAAYNIGIMLFSPRSVDFAREWVKRIEDDPNVWDQNAFNELARRGTRAFPDDHPSKEKRLYLGDEGRIVVGVLPVATFASGHTFFVSRLHEQLNLDPYVVHATFMFSGTPGKRNRMREFMLWNDEPDYYDHAVGFLTWNMDVPEALLAAAAPKHPTLECCEQQQGHFDLVNHQLLQTRHALAIAQALGRAVVVPQFLAGQDRFWFPHTGTAAGAPTPLPYRAPIDHIFDLEGGLGRHKDPAQFGPDIEYREYSFVHNPRMPQAVRDSHVVVELCAPDSLDAACADGSSPAVETGGRVKLKAGLNDKQIKVALSGVNGRYKVMEFTSMVGAFSRHASDDDHTRFVARTTAMTSIWCCVDARPGHVWYDMWWDTPGHKDRHGRTWEGAWTITTGP